MRVEVGVFIYYFEGVEIHFGSGGRASGRLWQGRAVGTWSHHTGRAGQGHGRAGQGRAGQGRAGQGRAGHGHFGRAGQGRAGQGRVGYYLLG